MPGSPMKPRVRSTQLVATSFMISANADGDDHEAVPAHAQDHPAEREGGDPVTSTAAGRPIHIDHLSLKNSNAET